MSGWSSMKAPHWYICLALLSTATYPCPDIDGLRVGDRRKLSVDAGSLGGHGEQGGDPERDSSRDRVLVEPEADPRDDDEHAAGDVDGDQVVGELPLEDQLHLQAAVFT